MRKSDQNSWGSYTLVGKVDDFWIRFDPLDLLLLTKTCYYLNFWTFWGAINRDVLLTEACYCSRLCGSCHGNYMRKYGISYLKHSNSTLLLILQGYRYQNAGIARAPLRIFEVQKIDRKRNGHLLLAPSEKSNLTRKSP